MNFKKWSLGLAALVGFGLMITLNAFTNTNEKRAYSYWQYNLNAQAGSRVATNYTLISDPESPGCDDEPEVPCVIRVDQNIDTPAELSTYLNTTYSNDAQVTTNAFHKKSAQ